MKHTFPLLGPLLWLLPNAGLAELSPLDDIFADEIPVVLSATRLEQLRTEAPASITVIDRKLIQASGATEVVELMRLVPGMQVGYFRGTKPVVSYQGITDENSQGVQVMVDGRSVYVPIIGGVDWLNLPLSIEDIERIEVIRGPNSTSFGSNSFQSVINITTTHGSQNQGGTIKQTLGERSLERTFIRYGGSLGQMDYRVSASHRIDGGYANVTDELRQKQINARLDIPLSAQDTLQLNFGVVDNLRQTPSDQDPAFQINPPRNINESNHFAHARWEHHRPDDSYFISQLSYSVYNNRDKFTTQFDNNSGLGAGVIFSSDQSSFSDRVDFEFEHHLKPGRNTRFVWGIGLRHDQVELPFFLGTDKRFSNTTERLFGNIEWKFARQWTLNLGALWENQSIADDEIAPRLALNYTPHINHGFRLIASRSFRTPVIAEERFNSNLVFDTNLANPGIVVIPNILSVVPGLKEDGSLTTETVELFELGYHGNLLENKLNLDLKLYLSRYQDVIGFEDFDDIPNRITLDGVVLPGFPIDINTNSNRFDADVTGFEVELNYRPSPRTLLHAGYAYAHVHLNAQRNLIESVPKDTINFLVSHEYANKWRYSAGLYFVGSMEYLGAGNPQGAFRRLDLNAGKTFRPNATSSLDLAFNLQLALDTNQDFQNGFFADNRASVSVQYRFE